MIRPKSQKNKKRILSSYITSTVSVTMVLFLLGILAFILIKADRLSDYVKEKIGFTLVLHDNIKEVEINRLQKILNASDFVKSTRYVDKQTAANELQQEMGEDFMGFLGFNPLFSSLDVKLIAKYTQADSLALLENYFLEYPEIKEVFYQRNLVYLINENVRKISLFVLIFSGLLALIFVALINNTIRISVYSQRFIINTMQLVGATRGFIRKPFIYRSIVFGIYGAIIAFVLILALIYTYQTELTGFVSFNDYISFVIVFIVVLALGIIISWLSTVFAVNKFLKLKFEELFY